MPSFIKKKLPSAKSLPETLKEERLKRQLSREQLSFNTKISLKYLEALEQGWYHLLPGEVYAFQFIKRLAKLYHLNEKSLLAVYRKEKDSQPALISLNPHPQTEIKTGNWLSPKTIRNFLIIVVVIAFGSYFGWEVKNIFTPPLLEIHSPLSQTITAEANIAITGRTEPETSLTVNGQEILINTNGNFSQMVDLTIGLNVFKIAAGKKHSRVSELTISILRKPQETAEINLKTGSNSAGTDNN